MQTTGSQANSRQIAEARQTADTEQPLKQTTGIEAVSKKIGRQMSVKQTTGRQHQARQTGRKANQEHNRQPGRDNKQ